jgi:hypothetical protein
MNQLVKKDLFAPIVIKQKRKNKVRPKTSLIPSKSTWKDQHGSWAVKMGIVKTEQN